jgi:hypothetical protein
MAIMAPWKQAYVPAVNVLLETVQMVGQSTYSRSTELGTRTIT